MIYLVDIREDKQIISTKTVDRLYFKNCYNYYSIIIKNVQCLL